MQLIFFAVFIILSICIYILWQSVEKHKKIASEAQKKIENSIVLSQSINKLKDEFLAVASHELRTPLTAIDGLISMILDGEYGPVNDNLKQPLADVNTSSERLIILVNDLLSLSRIRAGRLKYIISEFDIEPLISEVIKSLQPIAKNKGLALTASSLNKIITSADSDKVKQILNNLIGNSLKLTDKGQITVSTKIVDETVQVYVSDTGIGIAKEDQPKIFGQFQMMESDKGRPVGTGLGLNISHKLVSKMGGILWLEKSEKGRGSTFAFSLPLAKSKLAENVKKEIEEEAKAYPDQKV